MRRGLRSCSACVLGRVDSALRTQLLYAQSRLEVDRKRGGTFGERGTVAELICVGLPCHANWPTSGLAAPPSRT